MVDVNFDGFSDDGEDPMTAWKNKLIREGKWVDPARDTAGKNN